MIKDSDGNIYSTVSDAARELKVAAKTVNDWIKKGIIPKPPTQDFGTKTLNIFPPEYIERAKASIKNHRQQKQEEKNSKSNPED
jgi:predicted site-specific integrase-resolvase